jgi:hypothetical protein
VRHPTHTSLVATERVDADLSADRCSRASFGVEKTSPRFRTQLDKVRRLLRHIFQSKDCSEQRFWSVVFPARRVGPCGHASSVANRHVLFRSTRDMCTKARPGNGHEKGPDVGVSFDSGTDRS